MAFCNNCGKPLKDGEVCTCQSTNQGQAFGVPNENAQVNQSQINPQNYQGQNNTQNYQGQNYQGQANNTQNYQGQPNYNQMNNNQPNMGVQSQAIINDIKTLATGIFKAPVETVSAFMQAKTLILSLVLIVGSGLVTTLLDMLDYAMSDYNYGAKTYLSTFFTDILGEAAAGALFALAVWLIATQLFKANFNYEKALAVFAIKEVVAIPVSVISWVFYLFKLSFFYEVASWFTGFKVAYTAILMFFAIRSVMGKEKEAAFTYALAAIGTSLGYYLIALMF